MPERPIFEPEASKHGIILSIQGQCLRLEDMWDGETRIGYKVFSAADVGCVLRCLSSGCINLDFVPCYIGLWFLSSCCSGLSLLLRPGIQTGHPHSCPGVLLVPDSCTWRTPPPSPALCVSSLQPTSRETSVSPSLSVATLLGALVNTVSANVCVAGSGCLLPSVWKLTEGRGYGQFCSQPCSCRTWCLMTIYSV